MVVWSGGPLTPRKYKPIFFVRCNAAEVLLVLREKHVSEDPAERGLLE